MVIWDIELKYTCRRTILNSLFKNLQTCFLSSGYLLVLLALELHAVGAGEVPVTHGVSKEDRVDHNPARKGPVRIKYVILIADMHTLDVEVYRLQEFEQGS